MKKRIISVPLLLLICIQLCGCSSFKFASVEELMRPPKLYGDNSELQAAFDNAVGLDVTLKAPVSGNYKSAFIYFDIDKDNDDEAFVFYVDNADDNAVRMQVMDKKNGEWASITALVGSGSEVNSVDFTDMNSDDIFEIVVSWNILESKGNKIFSIYKFEVGENIVAASAICTEAFTIMKTVDIDADSDTEVFFILLDTTSEVPKSVARVLKMNEDGKLALSGEVNLDGNVSGYSTIEEVIGSKDGIYKLYIDAYKGETQMITEVIYWNSETSTLEAPSFDSQTQSNSQTWRSVRLPTYDIDDDDELEIPVQIKMNGGVTVAGDVNSFFYITKWYKLNGKELIEAEQNAVNFDCKYIVNLSSKWADSITIYSTKQSNEWKVFLYDAANSVTKDLLFTIACVNKSTWNEYKDVEYVGYSEVFENSANKTVIAAAITQSGEDMGLSMDKLKEIISIFNVG